MTVGEHFELLFGVCVYVCGVPVHSLYVLILLDSPLSRGFCIYL